MKSSDNCFKLIAHYEGNHLEAYPDPGSALGKMCTSHKLSVVDYKKLQGWQKLNGSPWTIGVGHTGKVDGKPVVSGMIISADKSKQIFLNDISVFEKDVNILVKVPITQQQFDALVSFAFNVGADMDHDGKAEGLGDSTLLKYVNARKFDLASKEFAKWNKSGGVVCGGLTKRRRSECELFMTSKLNLY